MTLTIHDNLVQGSDEWLEVRRGIVTASIVGKLITPKTIKPASNPETRALTASLVAERINGWSEPVYINSDMERGILDEPIARAKYAEHYAPVTETGFMVEDKWGYKIGYSPDGLVGNDGLIEIKSRRAKTHLSTIVSGHPPIDNIAQMQCGMLISGRQWCDYVSWCGGMPMFVHRVYPNQKWFDAIVEAVRIFEENAKQMMLLYQDGIDGLHPTERTNYDLDLVI